MRIAEFFVCLCMDYDGMDAVLYRFL